MRILAVLVVVLSATLVTPAYAATDVVETITGERFSAARELARTEALSGAEPAWKTAERQRFVADSARLADVRYAASDVDVVELSGVRVMVPRDTQVDGITVRRLADGRRTADLATTQTAAANGVVPQDIEQPFWFQKASGTYRVVMNGVGEMLSKWATNVLVHDGDRTNDYWALHRKAWGQAYEVDGLNWSVTGMEISSAPVIFVRPYLIGWEDMSPGQDFEGNCDPSPFNMTVGVKGVELASNFQDCDEYDITFNSLVPGDFKNYFDQGAVFDSDNREVGFQTALKAKADEQIYFSHYQRLEMARWTYPAKKCESRDSGASCNP